ncbi:MAG TPA: hypothetical protein VGZ47_23560 [Gemmataceae bacterium]|nr:hypothetical protein [Gemmataceae bacterium]
MLGSDRSRRRRLVQKAATTVIAIYIVVLGCRQIPVDEAAPVLTPSAGSGATAARLESGRSIYVSEAKCAHCHSPKPVYEHTADQWAKEILPRMGKKAKLAPDEYDSVLAYVTAGAQLPRKGNN